MCNTVRSGLEQTHYNSWCSNTRKRSACTSITLEFATKLVCNRRAEQTYRSWPICCAVGLYLFHRARILKTIMILPLFAVVNSVPPTATTRVGSPKSTENYTLHCWLQAGYCGTNTAPPDYSMIKVFDWARSWVKTWCLLELPEI